MVELTVALHYVFDFEEDKLVWDVGHQAYIHKLLTGRKKEFDSIRTYGGLSGFPKISESSYDHFGTGHSSTSLSAIIGMAEAAVLNEQDRKHVAVIGDGSLSGGMAFEAMNNLGASSADVLLLVNDNQMGIDPNAGALNHHLAHLEQNRENLFENLGITYSGPIDGHDVVGLVEELRHQKDISYPRVLHIKTIKGKGYEAAEIEQTKYHSVKYVKIDTHQSQDEPNIRFQDVFGQTLLDLAQQDDRVVGITPAMPSGSSMKVMMDAMPDRVFDVGIAEQHAVTFAAGLALEGKRPFCHLYSSFAQRAYDQMIHDVALQNIPVIFCLDRAGLVGADGPTHHGVFDLAVLSAIPNLKIVSPMDLKALKDAMHWAMNQQGPVVIRYPRGSGGRSGLEDKVELEHFESANLRCDGDKLAVLSSGSIGEEVQKAIHKGDLQDEIYHLDAHMLKPLDLDGVRAAFSFDRVITIEENVAQGGLGQQIKALAQDHGYQGTIISLAIPDEFSPHGSKQELRERYGMDAVQLLSLFNDIIK